MLEAFRTSVGEWITHTRLLPTFIIANLRAPVNGDWARPPGFEPGPRG